MQAVNTAQVGLKTGPKHIYRHPKRSGITYGKHHFDPFLTHVGPPFGGHRLAQTPPNAAKRHLAVSLGQSEGWKKE